MSFQETCDFIFKLYLYADNAKMIHYTIDSMHGHELADDVRDTIIEFADDLAEQYFGYYGKPRFGQLSVKQEIKTTGSGTGYYIVNGYGATVKTRHWMVMTHTLILNHAQRLSHTVITTASSQMDQQQFQLPERAMLLAAVILRVTVLSRTVYVV